MCPMVPFLDFQPQEAIVKQAFFSYEFLALAYVASFCSVAASPVTFLVRTLAPVFQR
jgi:hypothetical protein